MRVEYIISETGEEIFVHVTGLLEDVREGGRDHAADPEIQQRPGRVLAA